MGTGLVKVTLTVKHKSERWSVIANSTIRLQGWLEIRMWRVGEGVRAAGEGHLSGGKSLQRQNPVVVMVIVGLKLAGRDSASDACNARALSDSILWTLLIRFDAWSMS